MMKMERWFSVLVVIVLLFGCCSGQAGGWTPPSNNHSAVSSKGSSHYTIKVTVDQDKLATRTGPSIQYAGGGTLSNMKGRTVTVLSRAIDNGGVPWLEIELEYYSGAYRRCWIGAERLYLTDRQMERLAYDYDSFLGYGTVNTNITPSVGPGKKYIAYKDYDYQRGNRVAVIVSLNDYYLVESMVYDQKTGEDKILRCWLPTSCIEDIRYD